jgi:hypothetical protein
VTRGSERFHELLNTIGELHDKKQADYGKESDPFANIRATEAWGMPAWVGAMMRANDKVHRLQSFVVNGNVKNESVEDSLMDIAVYALIALVLFEEDNAS